MYYTKFYYIDIHRFVHAIQGAQANATNLVVQQNFSCRHGATIRDNKSFFKWFNEYDSLASAENVINAQKLVALWSIFKPYLQGVYSNATRRQQNS